MGSHHGSQEDPAQHTHRGQRGHSALMAADVVHQRTDLLTGQSCVVSDAAGTDVKQKIFSSLINCECIFNRTDFSFILLMFLCFLRTLVL